MTNEVDEADHNEDRIPAIVLDVAALVVIAALNVLTTLSISAGVTGPVALVYLTFVPGWAVVTNWSAADRHAPFALSVALSLSITACNATAALWLHLWHPLAIFRVEGAAAAAAAGCSPIARC